MEVPYNNYDLQCVYCFLRASLYEPSVTHTLEEFSGKLDYNIGVPGELAK